VKVNLDVDTVQLRQQVKDLKAAAKSVVTMADNLLERLDQPLVVNVTPVASEPPPTP